MGTVGGSHGVATLIYWWLIFPIDGANIEIAEEVGIRVWSRLSLTDYLVARSERAMSVSTSSVSVSCNALG